MKTIKAPRQFRHGDWKAICDRCGLTYYASQLQIEWTGLRVCHGPETAQCWEPRHPQDKVRGVPDRQAPPWARPEPEDREVSVLGEVQESDL